MEWTDFVLAEIRVSNFFVGSTMVMLMRVVTASSLNTQGQRCNSEEQVFVTSQCCQKEWTAAT